MKFEPDSLAGTNTVTRLDAARLWVGTTAFTHSLLVPWRGAVLAWEVPRFEALVASHFERIAALEPEVVILGSGDRLRFAPPALTVALIARRIGVECMDNAAAARTFNVLASEGRRVVGAFIVGPAEGLAG